MAADPQGCIENDELLSLAQARADAEEAYGTRLQELAKTAVRRGGFSRDDGASARKAFEGMKKEMEEVPATATTTPPPRRVILT